MKKSILLYLKHVLVTVLVAAVVGLILLVLSDNSMKFNRNYSINSSTLDNEGPFYLYGGDSTINEVYVRGTMKEGYSTEESSVKDSIRSARVFYYPDSTFFEVPVPLATSFEPEISHYESPDKILMISDIEGGFASFRKLLTANKVVDADLNWIFGKGHLVLAGDFVDRGYFVTQVLYLILKMEQQALQAGGKVHYILGNHEIMNMQGDDDYAASKYRLVASILNVQYDQLFDNKTTFFGRWLHSKNIIEKIGDNLIVHGGLHADFAKSNLTLDSINQKTRRRYSKFVIPMSDSKRKEDELLFSTEKSPYWYRGYFKEKPTTESIDSVLNHFGAKRIIVGHTVQGSVRSLFDGRVIAIDVNHPQEEWGSYFPKPNSEGLLIEKNVLYRVNDEGEKEELK